MALVPTTVRENNVIKPQQAAPMGHKSRVSSDNAWPLRNSEGLTFAEAKRLKEQGPSK
jgi:hypothetical protein